MTLTIRLTTGLQKMLVGWRLLNGRMRRVQWMA
jgi:hypothetical protein